MTRQVVFNPLSGKLDIVDIESMMSLVAGEILGGHRAVRINAAGKVIYADHSVSPSVIGVSRHAAVADATVTVVAAGPLDEPGWTWTPGESVFLGPAGALTQDVPASGWVVPIGYAISATRLLIEIGDPTLIQ